MPKKIPSKIYNFFFKQRKKKSYVEHNVWLFMCFIINIHIKLKCTKKKISLFFMFLMLIRKLPELLACNPIR